MNYITTRQKPPLSFPSVSGAVCSFNSQYAGLPLKSHKIALTATQSGSGTPSPDNVRPISGYSAINISHSDADTSNPTVYTITIGSTVYGGEYDAISGILTVTHYIIDLGDLNYTYMDNTFRSPLSSLPDIDTSGFSLCSGYKFYSSSGGQTNYTYRFGATNLVIKNTDYTNPATFKTNMAGIKLLYAVTTPQTIQLPPCPIDTLEGVNNIWADTGDTTLQYIKLG